MVNVSNKQNSAVIKVTSSNGNTIVTAKADSAQFWSNQSKDSAQESKNWANKLGDAVDGIEYSAKHYANLANSYVEGFEDVVNSNTNDIIAISNDYINQITETANESISSVENKINEANELVNSGIANINTTKNTAVDSINATKTNILKDIEFVADGEKEEIQELADKAKDDIESTGFYMRDDKLYFINSKGEEEEFKSGGINDKITNCLLEVPQNIKLELADGVLTLKAGSVVTVPNGFETDGTTPKFDEMTIESDLAVIGANEQTFVFYSPMRTDDIHYDYLSSANICSGSTDSLAGVNPHIWYDTTNNLIKVFTNSSTTPARNISFPFCIATAVNNEFTSIDQVFNGMGYIGSTVWVDKGVKGLIPNGRNEDGTLNNIEFTTPSVLVSTQTGGNRDFVGIGRNSATSYYVYRGASANYKYDKESNVNLDVPNNAQWNILPIGSTTGDITSFNPKQPFRTVDYNEAVVKSSLKDCQVVIETYVNGTSGYRIWSDGYCEQWGKQAEGQVALLKAYKNTDYNITCSSYFNSAGSDYTEAIHNVTTTSFQVTLDTSGSQQAVGVYWRTCGYIA